MLYLIDANVLITANNQYYPISQVPQFWNWILDNSKKGKIKLAKNIFFEFLDDKSDDEERTKLFHWIKDNKENLVLTEEVNKDDFQKIIYDGYASDIEEHEIEIIGADPFLIAYAFKNPSQRTVVTLENSKPSSTRANRKIPDVCKQFNIKCINTFELIRILNFSTA